MKYIPKEERQKTKQSVKTVFSNNFYMLKLIFSASLVSNPVRYSRQSP